MTQAVTATGQVAHDAGMSFEQLAAISAKVAERTREDGSSIGNAMKTIITRISKVNKMPQYADEIDSSAVSKASESLATVGVQVYNPSGEMNDMITILSQLREKWDDLSDAQQANIAFNIAATRQTSKFKNILMAWTDSMELAEHATTAQGGALENQEKYEESIVGKTQKIRTELDSFWIDLYNSDATKGALDFVINLAEAFNELADNIGPLQALLTTAFGGVALKGLGSGLFGMLKAGGGLSVPSLKGLQAYSILSNISALNGNDFAATQDAMVKLFPKAGFADEAIKDMTSLELAADNVVKKNLQLVKTFALIAAAALAIYAVKKIYDEIATSTDAIIKRNKRMIEQDAKRIQAIKDEKSDYDDNASSLQSLLDRYKEAEVGSEEYYNIRQQIADQSPELIVGHDAEGQAIIATNDQIQAQIDKYKELSLAKQEALKEQARENIKKETGETDTYLGQESYKELIARREKLQAELEALQKKEKNKTIIHQYDEMGNYIGDYEYSIEKDPKAEKIKTELEKISEQLGSAQESLKSNYAYLVGTIDEGNEQLIDALSNLENIAANIGVSDLKFDQMFSILKKTDFTKENNIGEIMQRLITPDYSTIKQSEYSDVMNGYLQQLASTFHLDQDTVNILLDTLDITSNQDLIKQSTHSILENYGQQIRGLGIDYRSWFKEASVSDVLSFDINDFLKEMFPQQIESNYGNILSAIKDKTVSELSNVNWDEAITDPVLKSIRGLSTMAIDWGLAENIQEAITLFGQLDLIVDDVADDVQSAFDEMSESVSAFSTGASSFNSAMSEMQKNGAVTKDTYSALVGANEEYKDALVESSSGMQLSIDKLQEVKDAEEQVIRTKISDEIANQTDQFNSQITTLDSLRYQLAHTHDAEERLDLQNQISGMINAVQATEENINSLRDLQAELDAATSKYQKWQNAQSNGDSGDQYDSIFGYKDTFDKAYEQGRYGDEGFLKFIELFTGETDRTKISENAEGYYNDVSKFIKNYFTEGDSGVIAFYETIQKALEGAGLDWTDENGGLDIKNYDVLRHVLTDYFQQNGYGENFEVTSELLEIIGKAFREYGLGDGLDEGTYIMDVAAQQESLGVLKTEYDELVAEQKKYFKGSDEWNALQKKIDEVQQEIDGTTIALNQAKAAQKNFATQEELSSDLATINNSEQVQKITGGVNVDVPLTFSSASQAESSIEGLIELKNQLVKEGKMDIESDEVKAVDDLIQHALANKMALIQPAYIDIEVSDVASKLGKSEEEVGAFKDKADELRQAFEDQHLAIQMGDLEGFDEATEKISTLQDEMQNMDPTGELAKAFEIDSSSLDGLHDSLMNSKDAAGTATSQLSILAAEVRNTPSVQQLVSSEAIGQLNGAKTSAQTLKTTMEGIQGKEYAFTVVRKNVTEGDEPHKYLGTASFAHGTWSLGGKAAARGDIGAKKTETALVGELGPEIRVRDSKWELLGQNGAEFTDVRKGDIIFNHRQSEALLKGQHINSRGKLIADKVYEDKVYGDGDAFALGTEGAAYAKNNIKNRSPKKQKEEPKSPSGKSTSGNKDTKKNNDTEKDTDKLLDKFKKALENIVDWIEIKLSRQTDLIDKYISKAEQQLDRQLYKSSAKYYGLALNELHKQVNYEVQGSKDYNKFADKILDKATLRKVTKTDKNGNSKEEQVGILGKKQVQYVKEQVQKGLIKTNKDIIQLAEGQTVNGKKLSEKEATRLSELISLYKEWYEKAYEADKAVDELTEQIREQSKALKELRDAERDAAIDRSKTLTGIGSGGFNSTSDLTAIGENAALDYNNRALNVSDKAYKTATKNLTKDRKKSIKRVNAGFKKIGDTLKGARKKSFKALWGKVKPYLSKKIAVPEDLLNQINEVSPDAHAYLIEYNQSVANLEAGRLEEAAARAANQAERYANNDQKYSNTETALNNTISLSQTKQKNTVKYTETNALIDNDIQTQKDITKNANARVKEWTKAFKKDRNKTLGFDANKTGKSKKAKTLIAKAQQEARAWHPISAIDEIADCYAKGEIGLNFYLACLSYNESLEYQSEARTAAEIAAETEETENANRALEKGTNVKKQYEAERQSKGAYNKKLKQYDSNEQIKTSASNRISRAEAHGHYASESDITDQIRAENRNIASFTEERERLKALLDDGLKKGLFKVGSDQYYEYINMINETTNSIYTTQTAIKELSNSLRELNWKKFEDGMAAVKRFNDEISHYQNLLSNETLFDEDNKGHITEYGKAAMDLENANMQSHMAQAQMYAKEIQRIQEEMAKNNGDITDEEERKHLESLVDAYRGELEAVASSRQAMIDYVRQAYEAQLSYLNKTIDKYKELKQAEKDAYDYQKQISESTKNITNLEKQLAAYESNTSMEAVAKAQKLRADLKEARENRDDQQYEKYLSDSQQMLDDLSNNFQEWIERHMKDRDAVIAEATDLVTQKINTFGDTNFGKTSTDTLNSISEKLGGAGGLLSVSETLSASLKNNNGTVAEKLEDIFALIQTWSKVQPYQQEAGDWEASAEWLVQKGANKVTLDDKDEIKKLQDAYNKLSEEAKKYVGKSYKKILDDSVIRVDNLQKEKDAKDKADADAKAAAAAKAKAEAEEKARQEAAKQKAAEEEAKARAREADARARDEEYRKQQIQREQEKREVADAITKKENEINNLNDELESLRRQYSSLSNVNPAKKDINNRIIERQKTLEMLITQLSGLQAKYNSFKSGSRFISKDQLAYTQENGQEVIYRKSDGAMLTPLGRGDKVFTNAMSENLWKLAQMNIPDMIAKSMAQPIVNSNQNVTQTTGDIQFVFNLPGVTNYEQFKTQLVADRQFQSAMQEMTLGFAMGHNSLSKYKYT